MRVGRRFAKFVLGGVSLCLVLGACAAWFAYMYVTDGDTAAHLIRAKAARFLPHANLELGKVKFRPLSGEVSIRDIYLREWTDGSEKLIGRIPWLSVRFDPWKVFERAASHVPWLGD